MDLKVRNLKEAVKRHRKYLKDKEKEIQSLKDAIKDEKNDERRKEILRELREAEKQKPIKGFFLWIKEGKYTYDGEFACYKMEHESVADLDAKVTRYLLKKGWKAYKTTSPDIVIIVL